MSGWNKAGVAHTGCYWVPLGFWDPRSPWVVSTQGPETPRVTKTAANPRGTLPLDYRSEMTWRNVQGRPETIARRHRT